MILDELGHITVIFGMELSGEYIFIFQEFATGEEVNSFKINKSYSIQNSESTFFRGRVERILN